MIRMFVAGMVLVLATIGAQWPSSSAQTVGPAFEKRQFNYGDWTKGRFSEVVTVTTPGKLIFVAGTGPEHEMNGSIQFKDNFLEQCRYAYGKVKKMLAEQGATMGDIVRQTVFMVDVRNREDYGKCRTEAFQGQTLPASTGVYVSALAWPYMLFEVEITAVVPR